MQELIINLENDHELASDFRFYSKQALGLSKNLGIAASSIVISAPVLALVGAVSIARVIFDNTLGLSELRLGNLLTVEGKAKAMLSSQGEKRVKKEIERNPENKNIYEIELENPVVHSAKSMINLLKNTKLIAQGSQANRVNKMLLDCFYYNGAYEMAALNFSIDESDKTYDISSIMVLGESKAAPLPTDLDEFALKFLTDNKFANWVKSIADTKYNFKDVQEYINNKFSIIFQERHEAEPSYVNVSLNLKKILEFKGGAELINKFLANKKLFQPESFLRRFLPAIREYQASGEKTEDYLIYELILSHKSIDEHIRIQLKEYTDIPKLVLGNKNFLMI